MLSRRMFGGSALGFLSGFFFPQKNEPVRELTFGDHIHVDWPVRGVDGREKYVHSFDGWIIFIDNTEMKIECKHGPYYLYRHDNDCWKTHEGRDASVVAITRI